MKVLLIIAAILGLFGMVEEDGREKGWYLGLFLASVVLYLTAWPPSLL